MELTSIEILIEKYFEGETSLKEEAALRAYFTTQNVPTHLQEYQGLFGYFEAKQSETFKKQVLPIKKVNTTFRWLSLAASVALLISVFIMNPFSKKPSQEELAQDYQTVQQALGLISKNLNKGTFAMAQLQEFDRTKNIIFKDNSNK